MDGYYRGRRRISRRQNVFASNVRNGGQGWLGVGRCGGAGRCWAVVVGAGGRARAKAARAALGWARCPRKPQAQSAVASNTAYRKPLKTGNTTPFERPNNTPTAVDKVVRLCRGWTQMKCEREEPACLLVADPDTASKVNRVMNQVSTASEFKGLIGNELDIESLDLYLECVLGRTGPTKCRRVLPTSGDYSLGRTSTTTARRKTVDILWTMANVIAPRFENATGMVP